MPIVRMRLIICSGPRENVGSPSQSFFMMEAAMLLLLIWSPWRMVRARPLYCAASVVLGVHSLPSAKTNDTGLFMNCSSGDIPLRMPVV